MPLGSIGPMLGTAVGVKITSDIALKMAKMHKTKKVSRITKKRKY